MDYEVVPDTCSECGNMDTLVSPDEAIKFRLDENKYVCVSCAASKYQLPEALEFLREAGLGLPTNLIKEE